MLNRLTKLAGGLVLAGTLATLVWGQAAPAWKDQGESDLGLAAQAATDPAKKLDLIKKWEQQYPDSALKDQRTLMEATALLAVLQTDYGKTDAPSLAAGEKAGKDLEDHLNDYFADAVKPGAATADQWATAKKNSAVQVHMYLAFDAGVKKDDAGAEVELKKALQADPNQALASYQLGSTIIHEMSVTKTVDPAKYSEALYDLARAVSVAGPAALPAATKTQADTSLKKYYGNYHGSADGLDKLEQQTASAALPPDGFHVESIVDIQAAKDKDHAAWAAAHPDLDFWENIKTALTTQGDAYFANLKDVGFPPTSADYKGPAMFSAKVVSQPSPKEILVSVDNVPTGDAILKFDDNIKGDIPAGTDVQFKGVVDAYTKDPGYVLTMTIQDPKTDITGLPADIKFTPDAAAKPKPAAGRGTGAKAAPKAPAKK